MKRLIVLICILFAMASSAQATRTEVMKWTWSDPSGNPVDGFRVYKRVAGGTFGAATNMGNPTPDAQGVRTFNFVIPETGDVYFRATAFDNDRESNKGADGPECADGATSCVVRWTYAGTTPAKKFYIYQRVAPSTTYGPKIDAGLPTPDAQGVYSFTVSAPASGVKFHAVSVVVDSESVLSNEICRNSAGQPCQSGTPPLGQPAQPTLIP